MLDTVVQNLTNQFDCDSIVTTITTLLPSNSEIINATTCNPANVGTVVQNLANQYGCDSIVTTITTLLPSSSEIINTTTCNPANVGTVVQNLTNQYGCDSIVTTITTLLPSSSEIINTTTCNSANVGTVVQNLTSQFGCDSIVMTITTLLPSSSEIINATTCNPANVGTVVQNLTNQFDCDSIVTTITTLLPSSSEIINATTCNPANVGTVVQNLTNQFDCDSIVTTITTLLPSSSEIIYATTCNPANVGTVVQNLTNQFDCDSVVTTITTLLPSYTDSIYYYSCNPADTGIVIDTLLTIDKCDSVITNIYISTPLDIQLVGSLEYCNGDTLEWCFEGCEDCVYEVYFHCTNTTIAFTENCLTVPLPKTGCDAKECFFTVYAKDTITGCFTKFTDTLTIYPKPEIHAYVKQDACSEVGDIIVELKEKCCEKVLYSIDGVNYQTSNIFPNMPAGLYTVYVMYDEGCELGNCIAITEVEILSETSLDIELVGSLEFCSGDSLNWCIEGCDDCVYEVYFHCNNTTIAFTDNCLTVPLPKTGCDPKECIFTVYAKDTITGCFTKFTDTLTIYPKPEIEAIVEQKPCSDIGDIVVEIKEMCCDVELYSIDGVNYQTSNIFPNMPAGTYTVYVIYAESCGLGDCIATTEVEILSNTPLDIQLVGSLEYCSGDTLEWCFEGCEDCVYEIYFECNNSSISLTDNCLIQPLPNIGCNLIECVFIVYAKDTITGCFTKFTDTLTIYPKPEITAIVKQDACSEVGDIVVEIKEMCCDVELYSIDGVNFQTSNIFPNMPVGVYTVYVIYAESCGLGDCIATTEVEILSNTPLDIEFLGSLELCSESNLDWCIEGCEDCVYEVYFQCTNAAIAFTDNCLTVPILEIGCEAKECEFTIYATDTITGCKTKLSDILTIYPKPEITAIVKQDACSEVGDIIVELNDKCCNKELYSIDGVNYQTSNIFPNMPAGVYTVYVKYDEGCKLFDCIAITQVEILSATSFEVDFCYEINSNNNFISFYIENAPVCEDAIYTWSFGNGQTYVGQNPPDILLGFVTYEVCLTIECNGCVVKCCKKVIVSKPCKNLNSNFNYIIPNNSYTATFLSNQTGVNYSWQITDLTNNITLPSPSSNALVSYTFPSSGNYRVCLTVTSPNNQCSFTTCNDIIINPLCKLKPIFEINLCDNVLQLENVSPTLNSSSTTAWTVTTANAIHNLSGNLSNVTIGNGSFKVCMTYTNGNCKTTICRSFTNSELSCNSNLKIDNFEEELESEIQFELHPNPFKSVIQINYSLPNELNGKLVQIKLYSETGVLIENLYSGYESNMKTTKNLNTAILPGIYLISLEVENFSVVKKMVKGY
jgi:hypothetical protein